MSAAVEGLEQRFDAKVAEALREYTRAGGYPHLLGLSVDVVEPGRIVVSLPVRAEICSVVGVVHGGAIASLVDHALSLVVYPLVERGKWVATTEFKINYVESVSLGAEGTLRVTAEVLSLKKRLAVARADVEHEGKLVAHAMGTLYVKDPAR
ncbi:MAG: PaaI family thioesterase [Labilithrix sp.]|nr:PaaI family thioesterase [Labilithrix sp.]